MYLYSSLLERQAGQNPVRVGLIGAGKFGSMFLSQVPTTPALEVTCIADLDPARAMKQCASVGWSEDAVKSTRFVDDAADLISADDVDVVVEATGHPAAGIKHALLCIESGKHVVMVNVEADVLAGSYLAKCARQAGVVYSMAYGDQLTNMLQPFWALPLLAITKLKAREILPYTLLMMLAGAIVFITALLII